ncbi:MAG: hypothetical protein PHC91_07910 [Eubacteriales bacterium]|nr:hypothetical protein [Eubacteriales bacterium]
MSAGIIGGADGPTAIFLSSPGVLPYIIGAVVILAGSVITYLIIKRKKRG